MNDLSNAVSAAFSKITTSGAIESAIEKKLAETINSAIESELRGYSDFGKAIQEHVKKSLQVNLEDLDLPSYGDLVLRIVRKSVEAEVNSSIARHIEKQLTELFQPAPESITLSKLVEDFIKSNKVNDPCSCEQQESITLIVGEERHRSRWISFDKESGKSEYECDFHFGVSLVDGKIFGLRVDGKDLNDRIFVGKFYGFERDLFQMYAAGTKLIIDAEDDDIDTSYPEEE